MLIKTEKQINTEKLSIQDIFNDYVNGDIDDIVKNIMYTWELQKAECNNHIENSGIIGVIITFSEYLCKDDHTILRDYFTKSVEDWPKE